MAQNQQALARLQQLATPAAETDSKPEFSIDDFTAPEAIYLGTLFTWLELLEDTIDALTPAIESLDRDPNSGEAKAQVLMPLGVWTHLSADTHKVPAPAAFEAAHDHAQNLFDHLGTAAEIISTGVVSGNPMAITLGSEHIYIATDHVGALMDEIPFKRPTRSEIIGA